MRIENKIDLYTSTDDRYLHSHSPAPRSPKIGLSLVRIGILTLVGWQSTIPVCASDLPPITDIPEEVLRAEIITEARSPIDGKALSINDFAELVIATQQKIENDNASAAIADSKFRETIFLLRLRGFLKSLGIPIK